VSAAPAPEISSADASAQRSRDAIEQIRKRSDLAAKTLGTLGTTAVTTFGVAKVSDVFPVPNGTRNDVAAALIILALLVMGVAVLAFAWRLWHVSEVVFARPDVKKMDLKDRGELDIVTRLYAEMAALNQTRSLAAYEARAHRWERVAKRIGDPKRRESLEAEAQQIRDELQAIMARASTLIVRRRAAQAVRSRASIVLGLVFMLALVTSGAASDYLKGVRDTGSDEIALAKSCAALAGDLTKAKLSVAGNLPAACKLE
jgi:hypothetical protein